MIKHSEVRQLRYSSDQMFNLVADINSYPSFIPWCSDIKITSQSINKVTKLDTIEADMHVSFKFFSETFRSRVILNPVAKEIVVEYVTGPFRFLNNKWTFTPTGNGCSIDFYVEFEFKSRMMQRVIGVVFNQAMRKIVTSFEKRAESLYGPR